MEDAITGKKQIGAKASKVKLKSSCFSSGTGVPPATGATIVTAGPTVQTGVPAMPSIIAAN